MPDIEPVTPGAHEKPREVFISYAWGDESPEGKVRDEAVERLQAALTADGLLPVRDRDQLHSGARISSFMRRLTQADVVVTIISDKYLHSPYCMYEIYRLWQRSQDVPDDLARHLVPVILPEVTIGSFDARVPYLQFWSDRAAKLEALIRDPNLQPSRESWDEVRLVCEFAHHVDSILVFLQDILMPRNLDAHFDNGFKAVREALHSRLKAPELANHATVLPPARADAPIPDVDVEPRLQTKLRVLVLAANQDWGGIQLDLDEEMRSLQVELGSVRFRDQISLKVIHSVRPDDLLRHVRSEKPHIVHFSGHASKTGIALRDDRGGSIEVTGSALRRFLKDRGVQLLVLNACYTQDLCTEASKVVGAVVGTTEGISDEQAQRFSTAFYRAIGDGLSVGEAFRDGGDAVVLHGLQDAFWSEGNLDQILLQ